MDKTSKVETDIKKIATLNDYDSKGGEGRS